MHASLTAVDPGFVPLDSRSAQAWAQGHVPGALHLTHRGDPDRAPVLLDPATPLITYRRGPGCDGATRAALTLARLGYPVQEMIGALEYWSREGRPVETAAGTVVTPADPLTVRLLSRGISPARRAAAR